MYYETVFIVNPDVSQENNEQLTNELVEKIEKAGARIVKREYWGSRPLAYSIQKRKRGHYSLLVTDGPAEASKLIDDVLRLDERVLRFLTTSITELSDEPSPLLRRRVAAATAEESKAETSTDAKTEEKSEEKATTASTDDKASEDKPADEKPTEAKSAEEKPSEKAAASESGEAASA